MAARKGGSGPSICALVLSTRSAWPCRAGAAGHGFGSGSTVVKAWRWPSPLARIGVPIKWGARGVGGEELPGALIDVIDALA